jgi:hypothetical protein
VNTQLKRNRLLIIAIFAMSIIPFAIAWYLAQNPAGIKMGTNYGQLVQPPLQTDKRQFAGVDAFSAENLAEIQSHWVLVTAVTQSRCKEACEQSLHKARQIQLMLGKDLTRIRRMVMLLSPLTVETFSPIWRDDARLLKVQPDASLQSQLPPLLSPPDADGMLMLMDPLGNIMMRYPAGYDPYKVRNDLSKLLKISQIG